MQGTAIEARIRELALSLPETYEDHPWGDFPVFKVAANKVFAWLTIEPKAVQLTVKLTAEEREIAHLLPYVSVARYVGRYGWITATVTDEETLAAALEWLRESYWLKAPANLRDAAFNIRRLGRGDEGVVRELAEREPQAELLSDERTLFLAAFDDSTPIGFVLAYELPRRHGDPAHLFVYEIGVREDSRRKGIGTALMQRLAALARERGLRDAFLLTNESNTGAMAFYDAIGAVRPNADDVLWDLRFG